MPDGERSDPCAENQELLVLISGLPAVGKSTLIAELGPRLGATELSRDQVRRSASPLRRLVDEIGFWLLRRRLASVQRWATARLLDEVGVELRAGSSVIVEALAEPELRYELSQIARSANARFLVVECLCNDRTEYERRLAKRPTRWRELVRRLAESHEPDGDALRVDTSGSPASSADSILAAIRG